MTQAGPLPDEDFVTACMNFARCTRSSGRTSQISSSHLNRSSRWRPQQVQWRGLHLPWLWHPIQSQRRRCNTEEDDKGACASGIAEHILHWPWLSHGTPRHRGQI